MTRSEEALDLLTLTHVEAGMMERDTNQQHVAERGAHTRGNNLKTGDEEREREATHIETGRGLIQVELRVRVCVCLMLMSDACLCCSDSTISCTSPSLT